MFNFVFTVTWWRVRLKEEIRMRHEHGSKVSRARRGNRSNDAFFNDEGTVVDENKANDGDSAD